MKALDPYRITDQLADNLLDVIVTRLEARGAHAFFQDVLREYLDVMHIDAARSVLDIGCGTGVAARAIARRPQFSGKVTGIDLSPYLAQTAARLATEEGLSDRVAFRAGDTRSLDVPEGEFDAVVAHTLVSHLEAPLAVVKEAARVVKPGGMIGIFDGDYASVTFAFEDPEQGKNYDEKLISAVVTSPYVMRLMPRLLRAAGLEIVRSFSYVMAEIGAADFWLSGIESFRRLAPQSGAMTEEEAEHWIAALKTSSEEGVFFGSSNYYTYIARRPA